MRSPTILFILVLSILIGGCMGNPDEYEKLGLPIEIYSPDTDEIDLDLMISKARQGVEEYLPDAKFQGLVISSDCDCLSSLEGKFALSFFQVKNRFWRSDPIVHFGTVIVHLSDKTLDINIRNVTDFYPSITTYPVPSSKVINRVLDVSITQLEEMNLASCSVEITQLEDGWHVLCDPLNEEERKCDFIINPYTFEIEK